MCAYTYSLFYLIWLAFDLKTMKISVIRILYIYCISTSTHDNNKPDYF